MPEQIVDLVTSAANQVGLEAARLYPQVIAVYWLKAVYNIVSTLVYLLIGIPLLFKVLLPRAIDASKQAVETGKRSMCEDLTLGEIAIWGFTAIVGIFIVINLLYMFFGFPSQILIAVYPEGAYISDLIQGLAKKK